MNNNSDNLYNIIPKNIKTLTPEEEKEVISYYHKTDDPVKKKKLKDLLILNNMAWIVEIIRTEANKWWINNNNSFITPWDLIWVAVEWINKAIDKYEHQWHKLATLAKFYVGYSVTKHIKENLLPWVKIPLHAIISSTKFKSIVENHKRLFWKEPTYEELKLHMPSLTKKNYESLKNMDWLYNSVSLSTPVNPWNNNDDSWIEIVDLISDEPDYDIYEQIDKEDKYKSVLEALIRIKKDIKPRDFDMFLMRYWINPYKQGEKMEWCCEKCKKENDSRVKWRKIKNWILRKKGKKELPEREYEILPYSTSHTLQAIWDKYWLTRERVRQITDEILKKIKNKLETDNIRTSSNNISKEAKDLVKDKLEFVH